VTGLFETMRVRRGQLPFLSRHLARLTTACRELGMAPPAPGVAERIRAHASGELIVRLTLDEDGERIETRAVPPAEPMRLVFSDARHEPYPHKTTDRDVFDRARARFVPHRADEAILLTHDGCLAEGCVTSIFFWHAAELCTPALDLGILPGVGRGRVVELARERGIPVREGRFSRTEVEGLSVFLVNAVRGIIATAIHGEWRHQKDDRTHALAEGFWG
jgi:branched-subunit amino acid aminotransferase/4-amino-4-deoxychorismate lyase